LLENFWEQAKRYLFPVYCLRCGLEGDWLCQFCESLCPPVPIQRCVFCRSIARCGETCATCRRHHYLDGLIVRGIYGNWIWRGLIRAWKYKGAEELSAKCARYFEECLNLLPLDKAITIIPIPLARLRERERGFNQAAVLAESISERLSLPMVLALKRVRETAPQSKLTPDKRLENVRDCFKFTPLENTHRSASWRSAAGCNSPIRVPLETQSLTGRARSLMPRASSLTGFIGTAEIKDKTCLIIDDIVTTGATMDAAAKELKRVGALKVWGLALVRSEANSY